MQILVTGGAGFIGSNFIRYILNKHPEYRIINLDKLSYCGNPENLKDIKANPNYKFIRGDICDSGVVDQIAKNCDIIINFAAQTHVDRSIVEPSVFLCTNIQGTHVLLEVAKRYNIRRYIQISCYDEKTKVFTYDGLKKYNEINEGDLVLTLNVATNKIEWKPVEKIIVQDYNGKMVRMETDTVDLLVTPNHRMLFQMKKSKKLVYKQAINITNETINRLPKYYQWEGEIPDIIEDKRLLNDFMYILGIFIGDGFTAYQERKNACKTGLSREEFLEKARDIKGQFRSAGKIGKQEFNVSKSWRIFLDIPENDRCRKRCEQRLSRLGIRWHKHKGKAGEHIYFTSKKYFEIFEDCGKSAKRKKIPTWALESPKELLSSLLDGLLDSDGARGDIYFTSSLELAHQVMVLCAKLGFNPMLKARYTEGKIGNRKICGISYYILIARKEWRGVRKEIINEINYNGKIWCLKIKDNKNFLIERNGKVAFCGNTDEVYGSIEKGSFTEESPLAPNSPYAASKASADLLCRAYFVTYKLPVVVIRSSNNFGPYQYPEKVIPLFLTNALRNKNLPLYGDGLNVRDWLYVLDNCQAIDLILHKGQIGQIYNVATENEWTNLELTRLILKLMGKPQDLIEWTKDRPGHDQRYSMDCRKLKALGWQPQYQFQQALKETIRWYQDNQSWWKKLVS